MPIKLTPANIVQCFKHFTQFNGFLVISEINSGSSKIKQTCDYIFCYFLYKLVTLHHITVKFRIFDFYGEVWGLIDTFYKSIDTAYYAITLIFFCQNSWTMGLKLLSSVQRGKKIYLLCNFAHMGFEFTLKGLSFYRTCEFQNFTCDESVFLDKNLSRLMKK